MKKTVTASLARAGIIAGLYVALGVITLPVMSGAIQFRASEGLCLLPLVMPESVIGLFIGCLLSNVISGCAVYDVILGSLITLVSAVCTLAIGKTALKPGVKIITGGLFPVIFNALFLPLIWLLCYGTTEYAYYLEVCFLLVSQSVSVYGVGAGVLAAYRAVYKKNKSE